MLILPIDTPIDIILVGLHVKHSQQLETEKALMMLEEAFYKNI